MGKDLGDVILAAVTRGLLSVAESKGLDRSQLLGAAGLSESDIAASDLWVPIEKHVRLGEAITALLRGQNAGLHSAMSIYGDPKGALGFALRKSGNHRTALGHFCRFMSVVNRSLSMKTLADAGGGVRVEVRMVPRLASLGHPTEALFAAWVAISRFVMGLRWCPLEVTFTHHPHGDVREHLEFFGCPVHFGSSKSELRIAERDLLSPIADMQHVLQGTLASAKDAARSMLRARGMPMDEDVGRVFDQLVRTPLDLTGLAAGARLGFARALLVESSLPIFEIAFLLGFDDMEPFDHDFTGFWGESPEQARSGCAA